MKRFLTLRRRRDELGVVAVIAALLGGRAADVRGVRRGHRHADQPQAPAERHPRCGGTGRGLQAARELRTAKSDALAFAIAHDATETGTLVPNVDFWCIVASSWRRRPPARHDADPGDLLPGHCPYNTGANYKPPAQDHCSKLCAIPCVEPCRTRAHRSRLQHDPGLPRTRGAVRFRTGRRDPAGWTGNLVSVACKGSCGTSRPTRWTSPSSPTARPAWWRQRRQADRGSRACSGDDPEPAVRRARHDRPQWPDHHRPRRLEGLRLDRTGSDPREQFR